MPTVNINDHECFYHIEGNGTPCLVIHGGLGLDHTYLLNTMQPLSETLELIYYDVRGNGRSGNPPPETMTHAQFADDADALVAHLGYEKVAVLGHSYGGFIALEMALRYPQRIGHLILFDTAPAVTATRTAEIEAKIQRQDPSGEILQAWQTRATTNEEASDRSKAIAPLYFKKFKPEYAMLGKDMIRRLEGVPSQEERNAYNVIEQLGEIDIPTLILVGRADFVCPPSQAQIMHEGIPNSKLVIFEDSGHFPNLEEPDLFFSTIQNWLATFT